MSSKPLERELTIYISVGRGRWGASLWFLVHACKKQRTCRPHSATPSVSRVSLSGSAPLLYISELCVSLSLRVSRHSGLGSRAPCTHQAPARARGAPRVASPQSMHKSNFTCYIAHKLYFTVYCMVRSAETRSIQLSLLYGRGPRLERLHRAPALESDTRYSSGSNSRGAAGRRLLLCAAHADERHRAKCH